jgi:hypothetical protein
MWKLQQKKQLGSWLSQAVQGPVGLRKMAHPHGAVGIRLVGLTDSFISFLQGWWRLKNLFSQPCIMKKIYATNRKLSLVFFIPINKPFEVDFYNVLWRCCNHLWSDDSSSGCFKWRIVTTCSNQSSPEKKSQQSVCVCVCVCVCVSQKKRDINSKELAYVIVKV